MPEAADDWVGMCIALRWADLAIEFRLLGSSEPGQFDLSIKKRGTRFTRRTIRPARIDHKVAEWSTAR